MSPPDNVSNPDLEGRKARSDFSRNANFLLMNGELKQCARLLRNLTELRDKILRTRNRLEFEQKKAEHTRRFWNETVQELMKTQREALISRTWESSYDKVAEVQERLESDYDNLQSQENTTKQLRDELSNHEFRSMAEESAFTDAVTSLSTSLGFNTADSQYERLSLETTPLTSETFPSLLANYYDRKGDIGVHLERLGDLDDSFHEAAARRGLLADQDFPFDEPESSYRRQYDGQRQEILAEVHAAEMDLERLAYECKAAGLDLETGLTRSASSSSVESEQLEIGNEGRVTYLIPARPGLVAMPGQIHAPSTYLTTRLHHSDSTRVGCDPSPSKRRRQIYQWLDALSPTPAWPTDDMRHEGTRSTASQPEFIPNPRDTDRHGRCNSLPARPSMDRHDGNTRK